MLPRLRNLATALSVLLCAGILALWARSCWRFDAVEIVRTGYNEDPRHDSSLLPPPEAYQSLAIMTRRGGVEFRWYGRPLQTAYTRYDWRLETYGQDYVRPLTFDGFRDPGALKVFGLSFSRWTPGSGDEPAVSVVVTCWLAVAPTVVLPAAWIPARRRQNRRRNYRACAH